MTAAARLRLLALVAVAAALPDAVLPAEPAPQAVPEAALVAIAGASRPTACAEEDNVTIEMRGNGITSFTITALPPPYLDTVAIDSTAPDFSSCQISGAADHRFAPRTLRLLDTPELRLVGHTFAQFWRPEQVPFAVGAAEETGLHLVQVLVPWRGQWREILVLYPADGYWRAKPLPPPHLSDTAYGSSFLLGPIEDGDRPLVALRRIAFEPDQRRFHLTFSRGGTATLQVGEASAARLVLDVRLQPALAAEQPFAALRSMYVAETVADVAVVAWQPAVGAPWQTLPVLDLKRERAVSVRFGREAISRHNTSAPDLRFGPFYSSGPTLAP
jgi:hypothetical protein